MYNDHSSKHNNNRRSNHNNINSRHNITTTANSTTTTEISAANPRSTSEMIDEMVADHYFFAVVDMKDPA